jgi:presenilin-like A22 family membrane protease
VRAEIPATLALGAIFALSIMGGIYVSQFYGPEYQAFGPDTGNPLNSLEYLVLILAFTGGILLAVRFGGRKLVKWVFLGVTGFTVYFVLVPILAQGLPEVASVGIAAAAAVAFTVALWRYPEWWVIDSAGVLMCVGLTAILGISFGILPAILLLGLLAGYDALAVYKTKHMIELADAVMSESLPIMFVIPKHAGYSFVKKTKSLKEQLAAGEARDALFMGLGDVIIPGALVVSAFNFLGGAPAFLGMPGNVAVAMLTLFGGVVGFSMLMLMVLRGNPQAGLPLLNGGTVAAYLMASFAVYGTLVLG